MKVERVFNRKEEKETEEKFYKAIVSLKNLDECRDFFSDILTPAELQSIKDRLNRLMQNCFEIDTHIHPKSRY